MNEKMTLDEHIVVHCSESMDAALSEDRFAIWRRSCPQMSDIDFIRFGVMRCLSAIDSGRHFIQIAKEIHDESLPHSTYFKSLHSKRRMNMLEAVEAHSYRLHSEELALLGVDYLKQFPELDDFRVEAADGHFIDHACHTQKGANGKAYAAGFIYALNLRSGLLRPLCCVTNGTVRSHEIPVLRNHIEKQNGTISSAGKSIYVYDKAVTDYRWWDRQKRHKNYMISVLKVNSVATFVESIPFGQTDDINTGVEAYSIVETRGIKFSLVEYRDPETQQLHRFVTTSPKSINPGTIAMLYYKRWTIEKAYNNSKSNLKEKKAWSPDPISLKNQMRLTAMIYNLLRVFEEVSKKQHPELIHPSDKKYAATLEKRQEYAHKNGGFVNPLFFHERIVRISSFTIRAAQNAIIAGKSWVTFMDALTAQLVSR
jgi:hypothetical protein